MKLPGMVLVFSGLLHAGRVATWKKEATESHVGYEGETASDLRCLTLLYGVDDLDRLCHLVVLPSGQSVR
jgi:hypothetical protein